MAKKILIVDDEPGIVKMLKSRLESADYNTITAQDGQEALDKIEQNMPDLVVLDMMIPKIDGYSVFKTLRAKPKYRHIPVVILTASLELEDVRKCITEGVEAYLRKPFKSETLLGIIKGLLGE
jgi:CheY-like chemotaxis protein